jgi:hypothetical protein
MKGKCRQAYDSNLASLRAADYRVQIVGTNRRHVKFSTWSACQTPITGDLFYWYVIVGDCSVQLNGNALLRSRSGAAPSRCSAAGFVFPSTS